MLKVYDRFDKFFFVDLVFVVVIVVKFFCGVGKYVSVFEMYSCREDVEEILNVDNYYFFYKFLYLICKIVENV